MTHTFPLLDYANATFETVAVNEKETFCEAVVHDTVGKDNVRKWAGSGYYDMFVAEACGKATQ